MVSASVKTALYTQCIISRVLGTAAGAVTITQEAYIRREFEFTFPQQFTLLCFIEKCLKCRLVASKHTSRLPKIFLDTGFLTFFLPVTETVFRNFPTSLYILISHITKKRKQLDLKIRKIKWLIGKNSPLSLENKLLIYKTVLKPIWTYGIALWGCASKTNISIIQRYQSKLSNHNKCSLVRNQPNTSLRPTHPVRTRSHERLHPQTSNGTGIPSQPPRGTPNPHNTHQETATTLDIR